MRTLVLLALLALVPAPLLAQVAGPAYVFVNGTVIEASEVNTNFSTIYSTALNRTGGTMTGGLVFSPDNTVDIGASGTTRPRDFYLGRNAVVGGTLAVTGASTFTGAAALNGTATVTSTTSPQFIVRYDSGDRVEWSVSSAGAVTVNAVGASQGFTFSDPVTVPAFAATGLSTFSSVATFTANPTISGTAPRLLIYETDATANEGKWWLVASGDDLQLQTLNDAENSSAVVWTVTRTGTTVNAFTVAASQLLAASGVLGAPGIAGSADTNTGLLWNGGDTLSIVLGGATVPLQFAPTVMAAGVTLDMGSSAFIPAAVSFASLPGSPSNGSIYYCNNCTIANPCAGAGTGAIAKRLNGVWVCN